MSFFEIQLNNKHLSSEEDQDINLITLSLVADIWHEGIWLQVSGIYKENHITKYAQWLEQDIRIGDIIKIIPLKKIIVNKRLKAIDKKNTLLLKKEKKNRLDVFPLIDRKIKNLAFRIKLYNGRNIVADIEEEETLQLVMTWNAKEDQCITKIDALTVQESGYTSGKNWLDIKLKDSQWIELEITQPMGSD